MEVVSLYQPPALRQPQRSSLRPSPSDAARSDAALTRARIIMHWSSAYLGYGTGSLDRDVREMSDLVGHLRGQGGSLPVPCSHSLILEVDQANLTRSQGSRPLCSWATPRGRKTCCTTCPTLPSPQPPPLPLPSPLLPLALLPLPQPSPQPPASTPSRAASSKPPSPTAKPPPPPPPLPPSASGTSTHWPGQKSACARGRGTS